MAEILAFPFIKKPIRLVPERLREARFAARLNQTELAMRVGVSRQAISYYEKGEKNPEWTVFRKLVDELKQPDSLFMKENYESFGAYSANFYRKKSADTQRRARACDVYSQWLARSAFAFNDIINFPAVALPEFEPQSSEDNYTEEELEECAEKIRKHFGLGLGPISNIVRLLELKGVLVARIEIPGENVEAFSYWNGSRPFVFLASDKKSAVRRRFDAAHELAHLCLHKWVSAEDLAVPRRLKQIEKEADYLAGAFMLPRKSFAGEVYSVRLESFIKLKARWKASIGAMVSRCRQLGLFDEDQILLMHKQLSSHKWNKNEPFDTGEGAIPFEEPLLLRRAVEAASKCDRYRLDELKADLAFSAETLGQLFSLSPSYFEASQEEGFL